MPNINVRPTAIRAKRRKSRRFASDIFAHPSSTANPISKPEIARPDLCGKNVLACLIVAPYPSLQHSRWSAVMPDSGYNQFCPVAMAAEVLGARWTLLLLRELLADSTRYNHLRRGVLRMSPALLSKRLKDLETAGIITRCKTSGGPDFFEYQ